MVIGFNPFSLVPTFRGVQTFSPWHAPAAPRYCVRGPNFYPPGQAAGLPWCVCEVQKSFLIGIYRASVPDGTWGDSAAPVVAGGMVQTSLAVQAAAEGLSLKTKFLCRRILGLVGTHHSAKRGSVERNPQTIRIPKTVNRKSKTANRKNHYLCPRNGPFPYI